MCSVHALQQPKNNSYVSNYLKHVSSTNKSVFQDLFKAIYLYSRPLSCALTFREGCLEMEWRERERGRGREREKVGDRERERESQKGR